MLIAPRTGQVQVGKLGPGRLAGRIDRGPRFVHGHLGDLAPGRGAACRRRRRRFRARPCPCRQRSVPPRNGRSIASRILAASSVLLWGGRGINRGVLQELARGIDHGHLAARAEARIDSQHRALSGRRKSNNSRRFCEKTRMASSSAVSFILRQQRGFQGRKQQPAVTIGDGLGQFVAEEKRRVGDQAAGQTAEDRLLVDLDPQRAGPLRPRRGAWPGNGARALWPAARDSCNTSRTCWACRPSHGGRGSNTN